MAWRVSGVKGAVRQISPAMASTKRAPKRSASASSPLAEKKTKDQAVDIIRRTLHQLQIVLHISPVIELIFRQDDRKLRLHAAHQSQRLVIQKIVRALLRSFQIIFQDIISNPVLDIQVIIGKCRQRRLHILARSLDLRRIHSKLTKYCRRAADAIFFRLLQCIVKADQVR